MAYITHYIHCDTQEGYDVWWPEGWWLDGKLRGALAPSMRSLRAVHIVCMHQGGGRFLKCVHSKPIQ